MSLVLEAVVARVATALCYLWPDAGVRAQEEHWRDSYVITLTTRHGEQRVCTSQEVPRRMLQEPGFLEHIMRDLPVRHAVSLAEMAVRQANAERMHSTKSATLREIPRDYRPHTRP